MPQHVERTLVTRAEADLPVEPRHGFGVVIEHVRPRIHDDFHGGVAALEIRHEHFDFAAGNALADGFDGELEELRAAVFAVVAIDAGDDGVAQTHDGDGFGDAARLIVIDRQRSALLHRAESAAARADVAEDHERGGAAVPALADVGAGGALADRMQLQVGDEFFEFAVIPAHGSGRAKPFRPLRRLGANCHQH